MRLLKASLSNPIFYFVLAAIALWCCYGTESETVQPSRIVIDAAPASARKIPNTLFGIFFEEINHAGAGGLWAELVSNRGFESGGPSTPSNIDPWSVIGDESAVIISTDRSSCFELNKIALKMDVLCDINGSNACPPGGVGIYNPGFWGMSIQKDKEYKVILYVKSSGPASISISITDSNGMQVLASSSVLCNASDAMRWKRMELILVASATNTNSRIQLTSKDKGTIWLDQVSVMPLDTYKGHGFRQDLFEMLADLKPRFLRFPGGSYVEGSRLLNAFRWKASVGPWEERPGHFNDVWRYWTDDGLGYFEFLQLAEDLGAAPVWVFNSGFSHNDEIETINISPFVKDLLESIEFARGGSNSRWGSIRAAMGHPEPFDLKYVAIGNQDCFKRNYIGNYEKFYSAVKAAYPDIVIITNCDASSGMLNHPADLYDFHVYTSVNGMLSMAHHFDHVPRAGPKAFVSEYAVTGWEAGRGTLIAALAQAAFLIGIENNSDVVQMASNAPLFVNDNDRQFNPDTIVFNSCQKYGTPAYWMQQFFSESSGAQIFPITQISDPSNSLTASAIKWQGLDGNLYFRIKVVNVRSKSVRVKISLIGLDALVNPLMSSKTLLTAAGPRDENSFFKPKKVIPKKLSLPNAGTEMDVVLHAHSFTSFDLFLTQSTSSS